MQPRSSPDSNKFSYFYGVSWRCKACYETYTNFIKNDHDIFLWKEIGQN